MQLQALPQLLHVTHEVGLQLLSLDLSLNYLAIVDETGTYSRKVAGLEGTLPASWSSLQVVRSSAV